MGSSTAAKGVSQFAMNIYLGYINQERPSNLDLVWDVNTGNPFF